MDETIKNRLKMIPGVDSLIEHAGRNSFFNAFPKSVLTKCIREEIDALRNNIMTLVVDAHDENHFSVEQILKGVKNRIEKKVAFKLTRTINATGVVVHTNLGRSLLSPDVSGNLAEISTCYSNLEFDLEQGKRGSRYSVVEDILCEISGAEAAMVVNNNAAAVLLCLDEIAKGKQVIISRGELVEIGGSFRIPDVMAKSGGTLVEVGTTNRTHEKDYKNAVCQETALFLKVHTSNYSVVGFTASVSLEKLVAIGKKFNIPVMEDLGSGTFIDFSKYGLMKEPTVQESIASGVDLVTFSGDKLLGGPQAGIILGKKNFIHRIRKNPITRALRIDKMTLAALESTLGLYRDEKTAVDRIPTLSMLTAPVELLDKKAVMLKMGIEKIADDRISVEILDLSSKAGGGSLPLLNLPSRCAAIRIKGMSANSLETKMRSYSPPIIGRIESDYFILDPRTLKDEEIELILGALETILNP